MYILVLSFSKVTGTILSENGSDNMYVFFNYGSSYWLFVSARGLTCSIPACAGGTAAGLL